MDSVRQAECRSIEDSDIRLLMRSAGLKGKDFTLVPLSGGKNNRVYRLSTCEAHYLLKSYFRHALDPRDRLGTEFSFISFAWRHGVREVPKPIGCEASLALGLYELIKGRIPEHREVTSDLVRKALNFYIALNRFRGDPAARALLPASESCFSIHEHIACVDRRMIRLLAIKPSEGASTAAAKFIHGELSHAWRLVREDVLRETGRSGPGPDQPVPREEWCLSPSDFGFHNCVLEPEGNVRFIDFEYAGWDDPAKMVCDFFRQPQTPVPIDYHAAFTEGVLAQSPAPELLHRRIELLLPLYGVKWCCIMMNDFLPEGSDRRGFAMPSNRTERQMEQLEKARLSLSKLLCQDIHTKG